ncbi:MAG: alpha/beta hydrolase family protein [Bacteroidota bacterium]
MAKKTTRYQASLRDVLALEVPNDIRVSPRGDRVAIRVRSTNWRENHYEQDCYIYDDRTGKTHQLTRSGTVNQMEWVDDETVALLTGNGDKAQVFFFDGANGEGWQVTEHKTGVEWFHSFAGGIIFLARQPDREEKKERTGRYGKYTRFEHEESASAVYYTDIRERIEYQKQKRAATEDEGSKLVVPVIELSKLLTDPIAIKEIIPSPAGDALYLNCWQREDMVYLRETRVFQIRLEAGTALTKYLELEKARQAEKKETVSKAEVKEKDKKEDVSYFGSIRELKLPKGSRIAAVSSEGKKLLIGYQERDRKFYTREDLWIAETKQIEKSANTESCLAGMTNLTAPIDREMMTVCWTKAGIFADYIDGTRIHILHITPRGKATPLDLGTYENIGFHVSENGRIGLCGTNAKTFIEAYLSQPSRGKKKLRVKKITNYSNQIKNWDLGTVETIRWQSRDGTVIEGVLRKPSNFDPARKYPLVLIVHGGPTWFSADYLLTGEDRMYYPSLQFNYKDVLVLKPNYRGSLGRGQAFEALNVNNLGVGDLWDIESGVDHLVNLDWVDPDKVGCMGWSQGGYISAFAGLHSGKFKAVSVGAGISDWYTYHISNDIPDFTRDYLSGSPFRDRSLYERTAPISNLSNARTPTLIQHGSDDRRVPLSNATELYRGLKEMGVPVELFIYPGMAHPITKPRENHAVMAQNLGWFSHYLLGEELKLEST